LNGILIAASPREKSTEERVVNVLELDSQLNKMIVEGKSVDAFKTFYAENVVAQENDEPERVGRDAWMTARAEMENNIKSFKARVLANAANGDVSFSEWEFDLDFGGGAMKIAQVAVRRWKDGRVVRERFYHK
jgi:ketosteroid isomerase-like protein